MVKLSDVVDAMDMQSNSLRTYLHRQTGELVTISDEECDAVEDEHDLDNYPEWRQKAIQEAKQVLTSDDFLRLPDQVKIHEYSIMEKFCYTLDAGLNADMLELIRGSGAFRRFKNAIHRYDIADDWYRFKQTALEEIAAEWLEENGIAYEGKASSVQPATETEQSPKMTFEGTWRIYEMEMWDEDYINMDVQAYITLNDRGTGEFQFGLVSGYVDGEIVKDNETERFEFTWEGNDEGDEAFGGGWVRLKTAGELEGRIKLHGGDSSMFLAKRP